MTRSAVVNLIDRIRDHLLIAKTALQEEDDHGVEKAAAAIEEATTTTRALVEELRS